MEKKSTLPENRTKLVKQALALGARVLKSDSVTDIKAKIDERIAKPGLQGMEALTAEQVEKADSIRRQLYVVERTNDCYGVLFDAKSEACTERCAVNENCVKLLLKNSNLLLADEKARAKAEAAWLADKANKGEFKPLPLYNYVKKAEQKEEKPQVGAIKPTAKITWNLDAEGASESDQDWRTLMEVLAESKGDMKTYADFETVVCSVAEDSNAKEQPWIASYKMDQDAKKGTLKLAKDLRKIGWLAIR